MRGLRNPRLCSCPPITTPVVTTRRMVVVALPSVGSVTGMGL
ncbi:hypothetical protein [Pseudonocardia thermophila]|nr:hypothetical protein [Pseudonocardia thermophila]